VARLRSAGCVFAEDEARLLRAAAQTPARLEALVAQRVAGLPLEQLLGWAAFCGLRVGVGAGVFVPRRRTELLVERAAAVAVPGSVVLDLCCGSGAVGLALLGLVPGIVLHAADIEPAAAGCARRNLGDRGQVHEGDLYAALPASLQGRLDVIVVNAPYVPTAAIALMPPEARLHEPAVALDGGPDGLDVQRRVAEEAERWLAPTGQLLVETSDRQAPVSAEILSAVGLVTTIASSQQLEATVVIGTLT
jgi:release factor glutamine methyltransferase